MAVASDFGQANLIMAQAYPQLVAALAGNVEAMEQANAIFGAVVLPEKVSQFFEFAYANRETLPQDIKTAAADVGNFAWVNGFWGLGEGGRGSRMERLLRGQALGKNEEVPEPSVKYAPAPQAATSGAE